MNFTIRRADNEVEIVDQTLLPQKRQIIRLATCDDMCEAISSLRIRGAPAIGIAAAYGLALALFRGDDTLCTPLETLKESSLRLKATRPTAVNLAWALDVMKTRLAPLFCGDQQKATHLMMASAAFREADLMLEEDIRINRTIGENGANLLAGPVNFLTHCNAGALATGGYGTALGVIRSAWSRGLVREVLVDETRPVLQGARLTAWELMDEGIPCRLICDNMAGHFMARGLVDAIVVGADRIAANGDTANKIGTYSLAVLARYHNIPMYVAAPLSTVDFNIASGSEIPIEQRDSAEITRVGGHQLAPDDMLCHNPAFDVTPAELITAIITEAGVVRTCDGETPQIPEGSFCRGAE
ncbi:MAG: S-methyl-5-thioribose-1-phosphate isomerase [Candidatus Wallbacteria bacterium HGW-Wallbacteria-1]|uniref:Methylthioribose-1-phosphate isomerase n=1 Tax=Candidatus Wallbacteria bacterium HGW-Wallbacteria-1 TaxID=2013854 RepID=A0A2N1PSZ9_9BACT|nr:MAG: S-methyl-5-thioribose-1-phosphate isomerase [Candidatus Wallbacteria bacterium HGW-Wallbacteria-1]